LEPTKAGAVDELTGEQIDELRDDLERLRGELKRLLDATKEGTRPVDLDQPIGRLTRMDAIQQQKMAVANRQSAGLRLQQVERGLQAIERDEYGVCRKCEETINMRRLKARPEAQYCLGCQDAIDRQRR
jgi:DnaK suppressor protein